MAALLELGAGFNPEFTGRENAELNAAILGLSRATYRKMVQNLFWATAYNTVAIPMAAGITFGTGFLMTPAVGAVFMSASTIVVAINAQLLRLYRG